LSLLSLLLLLLLMMMMMCVYVDVCVWGGVAGGGAIRVDEAQNTGLIRSSKHGPS